MPPKSVTETELVQWLLDEANRLGPADWGHQKLVEFLDLRDDMASEDARERARREFRGFVERLAVESAATGAAPLQPTLMFERGRSVRGYKLESFRRSIAGQGSKNLAMLTICDQDGAFFDRVRRCGFSGCRKFYLPEKTTDGPLGKYCSPGHGEKGKLERTLDRVKAKRLNMPVEEYRRKVKGETDK